MSKVRTATIVDYGLGNIFSVQRAFEMAGARVDVTSDPDRIIEAERLVLPGVGAFADGMAGLAARALIEPIVEFSNAGKPLIGICLGMQMLATESEEFGQHAGLGLVPGRVVSIPGSATSGARHKIPHTGWAEIREPSTGRWLGTALESTPEHSSVYLVHSFHLLPNDSSDLLATCDYGGHRITAGVVRENVLGFQFHPEKSAKVGLDILRAFVFA
jgi:glutamine amidotransferase